MLEKIIGKIGKHAHCPLYLAGEEDILVTRELSVVVLRARPDVREVGAVGLARVVASCNKNYHDLQLQEVHEVCKTIFC